MNVSIAFLRLAAALVLLTAASGAFAQDWPRKPIRLIIPIAAGGATDQVARLVASRLSTSLGQQVVAENITGASGSIALQRLAQSEPDGHTLGATASSLHTIAPFTSKLPYDAIAGFTPIGTYASFEFLMVVAPDSPIKSLAELLSKAKRSPMEVSFGSSGVGTGNHLAGVLLGNMTGSELNSVPYRGGSPAMLDVIAGRTTFIFDVLGGSVPLVQSGKVRALAVSGPKRHALFPSVPAVAEQVPGYEATGWFGLIGPKGLPPGILKRLNDELAKIQASAEYKEQLQTLGYSPMPGTPADMEQKIRADAAKWGEVVKSLPCSSIADRPGCN